MGEEASQPRTKAAALALGACIAALAGCGGQQQDAQEPSGNFPVSVVNASFPASQNIAKTSNLVIAVRNSGSRTVPNVSVTIKCGSGLGGGFNTTADEADIADRNRPLFAINKIPTLDPADHSLGHRPLIDPAPLERSSAYVDTWPLGPLPSGKSVTFRWSVTAVKAGPYKLCWRVNAGLYGKAKATAASGGGPINGVFSGNISNVAPKADLAPDSHTVVTSGR